MRHVTKPTVFVRVEDQRSVFKSLFLRQVAFRKLITSADVKAGLRPRMSA